MAGWAYKNESMSIILAHSTFSTLIACALYDPKSLISNSTWLEFDLSMATMVLIQLLEVVGL